jgi:hypothetical protein
MAQKLRQKNEPNYELEHDVIKKAATEDKSGVPRNVPGTGAIDNVIAHCVKCSTPYGAGKVAHAVNFDSSQRQPSCALPAYRTSLG